MDQSIGGAPIGSRIKALRLARGLTAATLANRVGVTENAIRKLEAGDSKEPRFSTGLRIARALGAEPRDIVGEDVSSADPNPESNTGAPDLASVIQRIREQREALEREGVQHAFVFGSVARGDATPESDVDVIVDPSPSARFSLFNLAGVIEILQHALGRRVDVLTRKTASDGRLGTAVETESVNAF